MNLIPLQFDSESFSNILLRVHSPNSEFLQLWAINAVTLNSQFTLTSFMVSILKFDSRLRL